MKEKQPYRNTRRWENLERRMFLGTGMYDIPLLQPIDYLGNGEFVGFNFVKSCQNPNGKSVHFFLDDYQFERVWLDIDKYILPLAQFEYCLTPDFSIYTDFPKAIQIYNHYRKQWCGAYLQEYGIRVIPTVSWSDKDSFDWCFDGIPTDGTVAVSSVGVMRSAKNKELFERGYEEMLQRLHPKKIIFYGDVPAVIGGDIIRIIPFHNRFSEVKENGRKR